MLYQPNDRFSVVRPMRRLLAAVAGALAFVLRSRGDRVYLDGMRPGELEDLGLRRTEDGGYRPFGS